MEGRKEYHILAADFVVGVEAADFNVVGAVLELAPLGGVEGEPLRVVIH